MFILKSLTSDRRIAIERPVGDRRALHTFEASDAITGERILVGPGKGDLSVTFEGHTFTVELSKGAVQYGNGLNPLYEAERNEHRREFANRRHFEGGETDAELVAKGFRTKSSNKEY